MKTEKEMQRPFMGSKVTQKSKLGFFSATDLVKIGNIKRKELGLSSFNFSAYLKSKSTREFIEELQKTNEFVIKKGRGRSAHTWVHPLLFIDIALSINPKFKVEVYKWLFDELLKYRNDSGDSFKKMTGAIYEKLPKTDFIKRVPKIATRIKKECGVDDWQTASQEQLQLRDKIHEDVYLLCSVLTDPLEAVRLGIINAKNHFKINDDEQ